MEVFWLLSSFIWGILKMWVVNKLPEQWSDPETKEWAFGQVAPVVLLIAPVISMAEACFTGKHPHFA
jgi:hypothetical protein